MVSHDDQSRPEPALARAPFSVNEAKQYQKRCASVLDVEPVITNSIGMNLALIPPGEFTMGTQEGEAEAWDDQKPAHLVRLTRPFYLGVYEVTQQEYQQVMNENPSWFSLGGGGVDKVGGLDTRRLPVENVTWTMADEFCKKLSELPAEKAAGRVYRLPTEAEWEYACRAGTTTAWYSGATEEQLRDHAWYLTPTTHVVGEKKPNAWGLFDMHGNVWEWCADWFSGLSGDYYASAGPWDDPQGPPTGSRRVNRGGSYNYFAPFCRSAYRGNDPPDDRFDKLGFRACVQLRVPNPDESRDVASETGSPPARNAGNVPADAKEFDGHWYKCYPEHLAWKEARDRCKSYGGQLVVIDSLEENSFVANLVVASGQGATWIGATDEDDEGWWRKVDGEPLKFTTGRKASQITPSAASITR